MPSIVAAVLLFRLLPRLEQSVSAGLANLCTVPYCMNRDSTPSGGREEDDQEMVELDIWHPADQWLMLVFVVVGASKCVLIGFGAWGCMGCTQMSHFGNNWF